MLLAYLVYACLWLIAAILLWLALHLWRRRIRKSATTLARCGATLVAMPAVMLLVALFNVAPAWLHQSGVLHMHNISRSADCARSSAGLVRTVDPATGDEPLTLKPCAAEWVVNDGKPLATQSVPAADQCLPKTLNSRPAAQCYSLTTLEFDEHGQLIDKNQLQSIIEQVKKQKHIFDQNPLPPLAGGQTLDTSNTDQLYVITYVHGWRHSAAVADGDVRRLRVVASNAARNIAERCRVTARNCRTQVLAVYAAWPGATTIWDNLPCDRGDASAVPIINPQFEDDQCLLSYLGVALNALSFTPSKAISDEVGSGVVTTLSEMRKRLEAKLPLHMLSLGHSLGGNVMLSGLLNLPISQDGRIGPADLTVLLNPATETSKWHRFADRFRNGAQWSNETPPRVAYLTAPCHYWPDNAQDKTGKNRNDTLVKCDNVVDTYFEWSQRLVTGNWLGKKDDQIYGIGHRPPEIDKIGRSQDVDYTHWIDLNVGSRIDKGRANRSTVYWATRDDHPSCFVEPSFLYCARERGRTLERPFNECGKKDGTFVRAWDFGGLTDPHTLGRISDERGQSILQANVQIGTGAFRTDQSGQTKISPVWGIRSASSAVRSHGGIASAPLMCLFNKLLLDDAAKRPGSTDALPDAFEYNYGIRSTISR